MSETKNQKLLPAPKAETPREFTLLLKSISALVAFILGFNFSRSAFFEQYPLFGINYLAEIVISLFAAVLGFFYIPLLLHQAKKAIENFIAITVYDIVSNFWEMQSKRIQEQRRIKQKLKSATEQEKLASEVKNGVVLDTSVLIDGRILQIVNLGFLDNPLIVLDAVVSELHLLSDNSDTLKRQRGRRGLDTLKSLKKKSKLVFSSGSKIANANADDQILQFAKFNKVKIATIDFNLGKVAQIGGVSVLNINDLVNAIKTPYLPGEAIEVTVIHIGKDTSQGVGYLPDGTMIVIDNAALEVGNVVHPKVTKVIQSSAGRMIFCQL